jgi:hypothetical protein
MEKRWGISGYPLENYSVISSIEPFESFLYQAILLNQPDSFLPNSIQHGEQA